MAESCHPGQYIVPSSFVFRFLRRKTFSICPNSEDEEVTKMLSRLENHFHRIKNKMFTILEQGCQIFRGTTYPNGKNMYQITINYAKWPQNVPNARKIDQNRPTYSNIFHCKILQNFPQIEIFGLKIYHVATLFYRRLPVDIRKTINLPFLFRHFVPQSITFYIRWI
jgi:hypothetical protein